MDMQKDAYVQARAIVDTWDFSLMRIKMQEPNHAGWDIERIDAAIEDYRRYMAVTKALDGYQLIPNGEIDRIWHEHILDTRQYATDCMELFGGFLHHYPYFGMRSDSDASNWQSASSLSQDFWMRVFGESLYDELAAMKCPQSCPSGVQTSIQRPVKESMKCPQSCPSGMPASIQKPVKDAMKCPQSCPSGFESSIEKDYAFSTS